MFIIYKMNKLEYLEIINTRNNYLSIVIAMQRFPSIQNRIFPIMSVVFHAIIRYQEAYKSFRDKSSTVRECIRVFAYSRECGTYCWRTFAITIVHSADTYGKRSLFIFLWTIYFSLSHLALFPPLPPLRFFSRMHFHRPCIVTCVHVCVCVCRHIFKGF